MAFLHSGHQALFNLTDAAIHKFSELITTHHISEGFPPMPVGYFMLAGFLTWAFSGFNRCEVQIPPQTPGLGSLDFVEDPV